MSEYVFETFDQLFKTLHRYGRRIEELESRVESLQRQLSGRPVLHLVESEDADAFVMPAAAQDRLAVDRRA